MAENDLPFSSELQRKALHLLALVIPIGMLVVGQSWSLAVLIPATLAAVTADVLRVRSAGFARFIDAVFGTMMRPSERPPVGAFPVLNGATWVLLSATLLTLVFPIAIAAAAFAAFMVADAAAAVVGRRFGRRHWRSSPRTLEGSAAFVLVGIPLLGAFPGVSWLGATAAVLLGAVVEIPSRPLNDNVRVPFAMALVVLIVQNVIVWV